MADDPSNGWNAIADQYIAARSNTGAGVVRTWAARLPRGGAVLDIGAGSGVPLTQTLLDAGLTVSAIDASSALVRTFQRRFPGTEVACEPAEHSRFFGKTFDGVLVVGLFFLLSPETQRGLISRLANAIKPEGRLLFTAPQQVCTWTDVLTGRESRSLGADEYVRLLAAASLTLVAEHIDEGENHYYEAVKASG